MNNVTCACARFDCLRLSGALMLLTALFVGGSYEANGIITRHDRDDARYRDFYAEGDRFRAVGTIGGGVGMLIDQHWVVTAAHVVREVPPFDPNVVIAGKRYGIERVIMHPGWPIDGEIEARSEIVDLALIRLRDPVTDVEPMLLYDGDDEVGREIIFVGTGMTGTGLTGPLSNDRKWRAATNTVEEASKNRLDFKFSEPPDATDLEGISGPGDSGGPALIERDGRLVILGVSSGNDGGGAGFCRYGSTEYYARISTTRHWIERTMAEYEETANDVEPQIPPVVCFDEAGWPRTRAAAAAAAFIEALGDDEAMQRFSAKHRSEQARESRSDEGYAAFWAEHAAGSGTPVKYASYSEDKISVLVRLTSAKGDEAGWRSFQFNVEPEPPHHLGPTRMSTVQPVPNIRAVTVMRTERAAHTATLTRSGTIVIAGGLEADESIEIFDPVRNEVRNGGSMLHTRAAHTATLLADGSIFIAGGHGGERGGYRAEADLYDPATGRSRPTGPLLEPRTDHTATVLNDGTVLLVGGTSTGWTFLATAEVYNPETGNSERVGSMSVPRLGHTATLLEDGRVLIVGGYQGRRAAQVLHHTAEIYDPRTRAFTNAGRTATARRKHDAVRLADGRVLIHGGSDVTDQVLYASTEIYDPASGRFSAGPEMNNGRFKHRGTSVRFDDGTVLIAAGARRAELFDSVGNTFHEVAGDFGSAFFFATATPLHGGDVVIVGGYDSSIRRSAQVWRYAVEP